MYGFIYLTENLINGKKYVGMCKNTHEKEYLGSGKLLKSAIRKYGKDSFRRTILQHCETFEELSSAEEFWIKKFNAVEDTNFYNLTSGGFGGNSDYMKEFWSSLNESERKTCRNWSRKPMDGEKNPMFGRKHSEETKKKIGSKSVNRNWKKHDYKGSKNPRSKKVMIEMDDKIKYYDCLKDFSEEFKGLSYSMLRYLARKNTKHEKYGLKITYV